MEQIFEYLIPVIIILFWVLSRFFPSGDQQAEDEEEARQPPRHSHGEASAEDERAREIQEEIRRKIAERRGQAQPSASERQPQQQQPTAETVPPPLFQRNKEGTRRGFPPPISSSTEPQTIEVPQPMRNLQAELERKRHEIEETRKKAEDARKRREQQVRKSPYAKKRAAHVNPYAKRGTSPVASGDLYAEVLSSLNDPHSARKAVLYYEILGTPVGLRERGHIKPSWEL